MDARARRAQLDRGKRCPRSRLPLVLRLEDVRHLRGTDEWPGSAGVLGGGRAGDDDRAVAQLAGRPRSRGRSRAVRAQGGRARALDRTDRALFRLSRGALSQGHEERLEGARLHRLHVLLLGLPGDRTRRPHRFRRPGAAGPTRPDRARPAQRCEEGRPLAGAQRHLPLRFVLQVRRGLPGRHSDRHAGSSSR